DNVRLTRIERRGHLAEIHPTEPVVRHNKRHGGIPIAFKKVCFRIWHRSLLRCALEGVRLHQPPSFSAIVTHAENVQLVWRGGVGANVDMKAVASLHTRGGTISFDLLAPAILMVRVGARVERNVYQPVGRSRL